MRLASNEPGCFCTALAFATTATARSITLAGQMPCARFGGAVGDRVRLRAIKTTGTLNPLAEVVRPNGSTRCAATALDDSTCALDAAGVHTILVRDATGLNTGGYLISIQRLNNPVGCTPLTVDTRTPGSIGAGEMDCFRFAGAAADRLRVRLIKTSGAFDPLAEVARPNGTTRCAATSADDFICDLDVAGTHTILVRDSAGTRTGAYEFAITKGCRQGFTPHGWTSSEWAIERLAASIPEDPFEARINGTSIGTTKLLAIANRVGTTERMPQVLVIASSGYLRLKPGADPEPPLPFGQSLVLGPAIFGSSKSFPASTLFSNPQVQRVDLDTSELGADCHGSLRIRIVANDAGLAPSSTKTNQIMNLAWDIVLPEPTADETKIDVSGTFSFTEQVTPNPTRTSEFQSFRLYQISAMFIDTARHDVDAFRYRDTSGLVHISYGAFPPGQLLPATPTAMDPPILDSLHTDDTGLPNGNTPSYRVTLGTTTGPIAPPTTPRAFRTASQDANDDNVGLWVHQRPLDVIPAGSAGSISFEVRATEDPLPPL